MTQALNGIARLSHLGVIRVEGPDASAFLQGQLTQDFSALGLAEARLAAYCSAKGRMLASFVGFKRSPAEVLLVCAQDLLAPTLKRLGMYVLRAQARLSDASADYQLFGLLGESMDSLAGTGQPAWHKADFDAASLVVLPSAQDQARGLWVAAASAPAPVGPVLPLEAWLWAEVCSGIAPVTAATVDAFVPQMLNYESVGGVNFKKGCYPGQEIVARSQFRGTLKRRAYRVHCGAGLAPGDAVFHEADAGQPCGMVALAAPCPGGGYDAIISIQTAAAATGALTAKGPEGPSLERQTLPYELLQDI